MFFSIVNVMTNDFLHRCKRNYYIVYMHASFLLIATPIDYANRTKAALMLWKMKAFMLINTCGGYK